MKTNPGFIRRSSLQNTVILSLALCVMAGCGKHDPAATQVVAKVNGDEISVHQVNTALSQIGNIPPADVEKVRREVLDKLINQQLAIQQAEDKKIDRSTDVMMRIDAAKREILTRAYLSQVVAALPKPSEEEAKAFYTEHPALFSQRRIYNLHEIVLGTPHPSAEEVRQLVAGKSMDEIMATLKDKNITFNTSSGTRAAEQIALPVLNGLAEIKDGETGVVETPKALLILHVDASQSAPVTEEVALQRIPQYLANEQAKKAITEDLERLKAKADIKYMDQPTGVASAGGNQANSQQQTAAKPAEQPQVAAEPDASTSTKKGISGL
jgi:EpsD family peptidyl-prolyl cis-trans isomerase